MCLYVCVCVCRNVCVCVCQSSYEMFDKSGGASVSGMSIVLLLGVVLSVVVVL